ncbi:hypothetical protein CUAC110522_06100 [Cutibacterium acnes subsp. acnes]|nr:hypothetical protein HMPREF1302_00905 [Propionibacterium sp. KPL2008]ESS87217.1 hypothetical protein H498_07235 [Cutibacterium acnes P6]OEU37704.1 hypothetical protein BBJ50_04325 [Cutibacterium acnes]
MQRARGIALRNSVDRAEIDHVKRAKTDDFGYSKVCCGFHPAGSCRENSSAEVVGKLGSRQVTYSRE